jgi:hypothetical protein
LVSVRVSESATAWEAQGAGPAAALQHPSRRAREFWKVPAGAAVVVGVAFSVLLMAVAFGVQAKVNALVSHPALPVPANVVPVHLIREILLWLTIVVSGAMLLQTAISTFTMGSALMHSRRDEIAIRRQSGVLRSTLLLEFARAMLGPCLLGGAVGEVVGITVGFVLRTWTVLPVRFTAVSTLSAFPVTVLLALTATLIPAWHSASASPALLRKE